MSEKGNYKQNVSLSLFLEEKYMLGLKMFSPPTTTTKALLAGDRPALVYACVWAPCHLSVRLRREMLFRCAPRMAKQQRWEEHDHALLSERKGLEPQTQPGSGLKLLFKKRGDQATSRSEGQTTNMFGVWLFFLSYFQKEK